MQITNSQKGEGATLKPPHPQALGFSNTTLNNMAKSQIKLAMEFLKERSIPRKQVKHHVKYHKSDSYIGLDDAILVLEMLRTGEFKGLMDELNAIKFDKPK